MAGRCLAPRRFGSDVQLSQLPARFLHSFHTQGRNAEAKVHKILLWRFAIVWSVQAREGYNGLLDIADDFIQDVAGLTVTLKRCCWKLWQ